MVTGETLRDIAFKVQHGKLLKIRDKHLDELLYQANNQAQKGLYKLHYRVYAEEINNLTEEERRILLGILKQTFVQLSFMSEIIIENTSTVPLLTITLYWDW